MISKLVCSLVGAVESIHLLSGTLASQAYGENHAQERFACNYGINPDYQDRIFQGDLKASGFGPGGEVRLLELANHPFFVAALFLPQVSSTREHPHPLVFAFLKAALNRDNARR